jgi:hypothetical protein
LSPRKDPLPRPHEKVQIETEIEMKSEALEGGAKEGGLDAPPSVASVSSETRASSAVAVTPPQQHQKEPAATSDPARADDDDDDDDNVVDASPASIRRRRIAKSDQENSTGANKGDANEALATTTTTARAGSGPIGSEGAPSSAAGEGAGPVDDLELSEPPAGETTETATTRTTTTTTASGKRGRSAYFIFSDEMRAKVTQELAEQVSATPAGTAKSEWPATTDGTIACGRIAPV